MNRTISRCKREILLKIAEDTEIFNLIDNREAEAPADLLGKSLFPQIRTSFSEAETGTYMGMKIEYPSTSEKNEGFMKFLLTIMIVSHADHLNMENAESRVDLISNELVHMLNRNESFGPRLELKSDTEDPLDSKYYFRKLVFQALEFSGINENPAVGDLR